MNLRPAVRLRALARMLAGRFEQTEIVDVWSRSTPKYRRRAIALLLVNAALFVALGWFTFWLRTGRPEGPFGAPNYGELLWRAFDPVSENQVTLSDFLLYPIHVEDVPLQIVVVGLLLASLISIPILVAILYRFPFALLFVSIVGFVALMPWLALTLFLSCLIASLRPLKFNFRYVYALIALIPVVVYLFLNPTRWSHGSLAVVSPEARVKLYAPFVLAVLASAVLMALVLMVARLVNYRPGAIAPMLAVMFSVPLILFYTQVGRDELAYRLLEHECGPGSRTFFVDRDENDTIDRIARRMYDEDPDPLRDFEAIRQLVRIRLVFELISEPITQDEIDNRIRREIRQDALQRETGFARDQQHVVATCDEFLRRFPNSRYVPNVLYLKGRALDMRVDVESFQRTGEVKHYDTFPSDRSREIWSALAEERRFADAPATSTALYRLAVLDVRQGNVDDAVERLETLVRRFGGEATTTSPSTRLGWRSLFAPRPASQSLRIDIPRIVAEGRKLQELIAENREPALADRPLVEWFRIDPYHARYAQNLQRIMDASPGSKLIDNLRVAQALTRTSVGLRIEALLNAVRDHAGGDGARIGRYHLAMTYIEDRQINRARDAFEAVIQSGPESVWADEARRQRQVFGL